MAESFGSLLVHEGVLDAAQLEEALQRKVLYGGRLDTNLLEMGLLGEEVLTTYQSKAYRLPTAPRAAITRADPAQVKLFPRQLAERYHIVPFALSGRTLSVLVAEQIDLSLLDEIGFMLSLYLKPHVAPEVRVHQALHRIYEVAIPARFARLLNRLEGDTPVPRPTPSVETPQVESPAPPPTTPAPRVTWSLEEAVHHLEASRTREELVEVVLQYAHRFLRFAALFAVHGGQITLGWRTPGHRAPVEPFDRLSLATDRSSALARVIVDGSRHLGPLPKDAANAALLAAIDRAAPRAALIVPVQLRGRTILVLWGDNADRAIPAGQVGDLLIFLARVQATLQRLILERKKGPAPAPPAASTRPSVPATSSAPTPRPAPSPSRPAAAPRSAEELVGDLLAEDSSRTVAAYQALRQRGPTVLPLLAEHFPGRVAFDPFGSYDALPEIRDLGPVIRLFVELGRPALEYLRPLVDDPEPSRRFFAMYAASQIPCKESVVLLSRALFDEEPRIGRVAANLLPQCAQPRQMEAVRTALRKALTTGDPARQRLAARHLAHLRDPEAVPLLIDTLGKRHPDVTSAAEEALVAITGQSFGPRPRRWRAWWASARFLERTQWLLAALEHKQRERREAAIRELSTIAGDNFDFRPEGSQRERDQAIRRWKQWWQEQQERP